MGEIIHVSRVRCEISLTRMHLELQLAKQYQISVTDQLSIIMNIVLLSLNALY